MSKKYPLNNRQNNSNRASIIPYRAPNIGIPTSIIPKYTKGRNIGAQVSTKIHLKNARGEEMTIYQHQQLLNLMQQVSGNWEISKNGSQRRRKEKR